MVIKPLSGIVILAKLVHWEKAVYPTLVTLPGIVTEVKPSQNTKEPSSMLVIPSGMTMEVNFEQLLKAHFPIFFKPLGKVTEVISRCSAKA